MLQLEFRISRVELFALLAGHCLAQAAIVSIKPPGWMLLFCTLCLVCSSLARLREVLLAGRRSVRRLELERQGKAILYTRAGQFQGRVSRVVFRSGWLTVLDFSAEPGDSRDDVREAGAGVSPEVRSLRVFVLPDNISPGQRRRLAVMLRFFRCQEG